MDEKTKQRLDRRLKIIEGQVRGLSRQVGQSAYCIDIITQTQAVKEALSSLEDVLLLNHLKTHASEQIRGGKRSRAIEEIMSVYKLSKRK